MKKLFFLFVSLIPCLAFAQEARFYLDGVNDLRNTSVKSLNDYNTMTAKYTYPGNYKYYITRVKINITMYEVDPNATQSIMVQTSAPMIEKKLSLYFDNKKKQFKKDPEYTFDIKKINDLKIDPKSTKITFSIDKMIADTQQGQQYINGYIYSKEIPLTFSVKTNSTMSGKAQ